MQICRQDMHPSCLASPTQWAPYQASLELHSPELSSTAPEIGESFDLTKRAASSNATEGEAYDNLLAPDYMKLSLGIVSNSWSALQPSETSATCHQSESYLCRNLALFAPAVFFYLTGTVVFALYGSAEEQEFTNTSAFQ